MRARLRSGGIVLISLRDYGPLMAQRVIDTRLPCISTASFAGSCTRSGTGRTIVAMSYHLFITMQPPGWLAHPAFCRTIPGHHIRVMLRRWRCMLALMMLRCSSATRDWLLSAAHSSRYAAGFLFRLGQKAR